MASASMLAGTVMLHGIPPSSKIGTEKWGQKYAIANSGVIDAFARNTRRMIRSGPCGSKAPAANSVARLRNIYASPSTSHMSECGVWFSTLSGPAVPAWSVKVQEYPAGSTVASCTT